VVALLATGASSVEAASWARLRFFTGGNATIGWSSEMGSSPLDGGNVLAGLLPVRAAESFDRVRPFGFVILYALLLTGVMSQLILPPADFLMELLGL
jgi:Zn-dependent protease